MDPSKTTNASAEREVAHAAALLRAGNVPLAEILCRDLLDARPDYGPALNLLGILAVQLGLVDWAVHYFREAASHGSAQAKDNAVRLASARRPPPRPAGERYLMIKAWGCGFWADVTQLLGCLLLAEITGRIPLTAWGKNSHFSDPSAADAFRLYFKPVSDVDAGAIVPRDPSQIFPPKWHPGNLAEEDVRRIEGPHSRMSGLYYLNRPEALAVCDYYIGVINLAPWIPPDHALHGKSIAEIYRFLIGKYLKPVPRIAARVDGFVRAHLAGRPSLAIHLRGSDKVYEFPELHSFNHTYFERVDREDPGRALFVLSDDARWIAAFRERYGARVIATESVRSATDEGPHWHSEGIGLRLGTEVMVDTYAAIACDRFLGNGRSNVSAIVAVMKPWAVEDCALLAPSILFERNRFLYGG